MKRLFELLIITFSLLLFGCSNSKEELIESKSLLQEISFDYEDVNEYHIEWSQLLTLDNHYYAYIYSPTCGHCRDIKKDMIKARIIYKIEVYYIKYNKDIKIVDSNEGLVGVNDIKKLGILGTPSLFEIDNHETKNYYAGKTEIINTMTNLYEVGIENI